MVPVQWRLSARIAVGLIGQVQELIKSILMMVLLKLILKARNHFFDFGETNKIFPLKGVLIYHLLTISTSSPQVNHKIYSEEDLLAIDSSPHEVIDQLAVETFSDAQGTVLLPPPSFQPTGNL